MNPGDEAEEEDDLAPPTAEVVARRAIVLAAVSCRGVIDDGTANPDGRTWALFARDRIHQLGLADDLTTWEATVLDTEFGQLAVRDRIDASWMCEALAILAWALGRVDCPAYDQQCDPRAVAEAIGFLRGPGESVLVSPALRPQEDLDAYDAFILHVHWRLRDFQLTGRSYDFRATVDPGWEAFGLTLVENDLGVGGRPLHRSEDGPRGTLNSITRERHRTSSWLQGLGSDDLYSASTDT